MSPQLKDKLFWDLSIRLSCGVMVEYRNKAYELLEIGCQYGFTYYYNAITVTIRNGDEVLTNVPFDEVKPYLYKMYLYDRHRKIMVEDLGLDIRVKSNGEPYFINTDLDILSNWKKVIKWLISHHFDVYGLIDDGIAIQITDDNNPYKQ